MSMLCGRFLSCIVVASCHLAMVSPTHASDDVDYGQMTQEELDDELDENGLGGPITLMSVGGAGFLFGLPVLLSSIAMNQACIQTEFNTCKAGSWTAVGVTMVGVGGAMGIIGGVWLDSRLGKRRKINRALNQYELAGQQWQLGFAPVAGGAGFSLAGTF